MKDILIEALERERLVLSIMKLTKERKIRQEGIILGLELAIHLTTNK